MLLPDMCEAIWHCSIPAKTWVTLIRVSTTSRASDLQQTGGYDSACCRFRVHITTSSACLRNIQAPRRKRKAEAMERSFELRWTTDSWPERPRMATRVWLYCSRTSASRRRYHATSSMRQRQNASVCSSKACAGPTENLGAAKLKRSERSVAASALPVSSKLCRVVSFAAGAAVAALQCRAAQRSAAACTTTPRVQGRRPSAHLIAIADQTHSAFMPAC